MGHVGPIIFGNETARSQLEAEGEVYTFRSTERTTGNTWWRESRTGPKRGNVHVDHVQEVELDEIKVVNGGSIHVLKPYVELSGFESVSDWLDAIRDVHGDLSRGHLYHVTEGHRDE